MAKISVANLKAGMKLIKPVVNETGMVMFGEGSVLTDQMITRLSNMNINTVFVDGTQQRTKTKEEALTEIEQRFSKSGENEQMKMLKRVLIAHIEDIYK